MRASIVLAFAAGAVAQYSSVLQPITQISDGQIQAPPATQAPSVPIATSVAPVETSEAPVVSSPPVVSSAPVVVPSVSAPVVVPGNSSVVVPVSSAPSFPNSTVVLSTTAGAGASSSAAPAASSPAPGEGAAAAGAVVSFGGVVAALIAFLA